jgi:hypothetical protein
MSIRKFSEKCRDQTLPQIVLVGPLFTQAALSLPTSDLIFFDWKSEFEKLQLLSHGNFGR